MEVKKIKEKVSGLLGLLLRQSRQVSTKSFDILDFGLVSPFQDKTNHYWYQL